MRPGPALTTGWAVRVTSALGVSPGRYWDVLYARNGVPLAQVPLLGSGHRAIEPSQTLKERLLTDTDRHQCLALAEIDPRLEAVSADLANNRQAASVLQEEVSVKQVATRGTGKAEIATERARRIARCERLLRAWSLAHDRLEVDNAQPALSGRHADVLFVGGTDVSRSTKTQRAENAACQRCAKGGPAGTCPGQVSCERIEPISVQDVPPASSMCLSNCSMRCSRAGDYW